MLKLITVTTGLQATQPLILSAKKNGWDIEVLQTVWRGFGTKLIETHNYLKEHPEVDRFIFCDAFDVVVLGTPYEFDQKRPLWGGVVCSAEKGCWPNPELATEYPSTESHFKYLNSGIYYAPTNLFMSAIRSNKPDYHTDDQAWFTGQFLFGGDIVLDNEQEVFNSHSFIDENEYTYNNGRVQIMGNEPIFVHGNGRSDMTKIYELIK